METTCATPRRERSRGLTTRSASERSVEASVSPERLWRPIWRICPMMLEMGAMTGSTPGGN
jgi:hypothetical protein